MEIRSLALLCALASHASVSSAAEMPTGYFRGNMAGWEGTPTAGVISATDKNNEVFTCRYDSKTYMEMDHWHVKVDKLQKGDPLKILVDRKIGEHTCYVLSLQVEDPPKPVRPGQVLRPSQSKPVKQISIRHGRDNVAGVVIEITPNSVTIHTREGERTFRLLPDTRYFGNGLKMDHADVTVNQRLSVETSRNLGGEWEAFQLTWGDLTVR